MSSITLNRAVTGSFIARFAAAAKSNSSSSFSPLSSQDSGSISSGLRLGAQTFGNAVQSLNSSVSLLNVAEDTLKDLLKLTERMMQLSAEAAQSGIGEDQRKKINVEFRKIAGSFRAVVDQARAGSIDLLSSDGIEALLTSVGLSARESSGVQQVFAKFIAPLEETLLASEKTKSSRPLFLSPSVYENPRSDTTYQLSRLTNYGINPGAVISSEGAVFTDTDDILGQNPGERAPFFMDETGTITSLRTGVLAGAAEIGSVMAVNETTGYSVIASTADFLGFNPSGYQQLFLFDAGGNAVQQITSNGDLFVTYNDADLSADDMRIVYAENGLLTADVRYVDLPSFGVDPGGLAPELIDSYGAGADLTDLAISNNGDYVAYRDSVSSGSAQLYRISTTTFDSDFKTEVGDEPFGFIGNGRIGFKKVNAIGSYSFLAGAGNSQTLASGLTIDAVAFSQTSSALSYIGGTFAIYDGTNDTIKLFQEDFGTAVQLDLNGAAAGSDYQLNAADTVSSLSLARGSSANRLDIGIVGQLSGTIGDSDTELYRLRFNVASLARPQLSASTNDPEYLLDSEITRRPDAYRVNLDLKELRKQIKNNIAVLEKAQNLVVTNMDLVRSAGAAFLQMSSQISDSDEADDVAAKVRKLILRNARGAALAQAENLEPIAVAALTLAE